MLPVEIRRGLRGARCSTMKPSQTCFPCSTRSEPGLTARARRPSMTCGAWSHSWSVSAIPTAWFPPCILPEPRARAAPSALCDAAFHAAGLSTGFYSSPHLHTFRERVRRDCQPVSEEEFASLVGDLWPLRDVPEQGQVTLFEFLTGNGILLLRPSSSRRPDYRGGIRRTPRRHQRG